ncbi:MAG TPA: DUF2911 domain-containing protein [Vicinamibacterales bacterium]|nr:DUF2911 domain-containing protein [Vicinamibacterales bacterium]
MTRSFTALLVWTMALSATMFAQGGKPLSPAGTAAAHVGGQWTTTPNGESTYTGGKWIEITYGRPLKRGRNVFGGEGEKYGKVANPDAPVWRAGANNTTQLITEVPIVINRKTIAPGTYTMFIDLKPGNWTLIVSSIVAQKRYDPKNTAEIWGAYDYKPDKDVVRARMNLTGSAMSIEQATWAFADMSDAGGKIVVMWDKDVASVPFTVGK